MAILKNQLKELNEFVENMRSTSSSLEKVEIIKDSSSFIHKVLEYTYNPYKQYNVTSKTIKKNSDLHKIGYFDLFYFTQMKIIMTGSKLSFMYVFIKLFQLQSKNSSLKCIQP